MLDTREQLPDLPALESVRTDSRALIPILVTYGGFGVMFSALIVRMYLRYAQYIDASGRAIAAVVAALGVFVLVRILCGYFSYSTNADGFTMRGPLRRKFVPWLSIRSAHTEKSKAGYTQLVLETETGVVRVAPRGAGLSNGEIIEASIWQHLRRVGRAGGMDLSPGARSLWTPIGDDVPDEVDWGKSPPRQVRIWGTLILTFMISAPVCLCVLEYRTPSALLIYLPMLLGYGFMLKSVFITSLMCLAHRIEVRGDGLRAECVFDVKAMPWSAVTESSWTREGLMIRSATMRRDLVVPYRLGDKESERLILAVIRHLRNAGIPQAVAMPTLVSKNPEILRRPAYTNERLIPLRRAFLNTLDEPARTRVSRLHGIQLRSVLVGIALSAAFVLADMPGRMSLHIHAGQDTRYFIPGTSLPLVMPLIFGGIVLPSLFTDWLCGRMAGAYASEWKQFGRVGASKFNDVLARVFTVISVVGVLAVPLFADWYMKVTDRGIAVNELLTFSEHDYSWDQVRGVLSKERTRYVHGRPKTDVTYVIRFADGSAWSFGENTSLIADRKRFTQAAAFVAARAGLQIEHEYQ